MMRYEYLYLQTLREFELLRMDPVKPETVKLQRTPAVKRSPLDAEMEDLEPPKRLRVEASGTPLAEEMEQSMSPVNYGRNPPEPCYVPENSPISDVDAAPPTITNLSKSSPPTKTEIRWEEEMVTKRYYRNPIHRLCNGDEEEELKVLRIVERVMSDRFNYYKVGLLLGVSLLRLDGYLNQNHECVTSASMDMLSGLVDRESAFFDDAEDLLFLLGYAAHMCSETYTYEHAYIMEYDRDPPLMDDEKVNRIISGFTIHFDNPMDLALLMIAEHMSYEFVSNHLTPTAKAERMGIETYARVACTYGTTDGRLLFFKTLLSLVHANGLPYTLSMLLKAERAGDTGETEIKYILEPVPRLKEVTDEILDDILEEEYHPMPRPHLAIMVLEKRKAQQALKRQKCYLRGTKSQPIPIPPSKAR